MSKEQAVKFLDDYKANRTLMEKVEKVFDDNPDKNDSELWVLAAEKCGYEFTPEELKEVFQERTQDTDKFAGAEVDERELKAVAGGSDDENCTNDYWCTRTNTKHHDCKYSFKNFENCWHNDGCDNVYRMYDAYLCKHSGECEYAFTYR